MSRHNPKERIGVHKAALFFEENFNRIFREQTVVDVGIDALIEKSDDGEPQGKFIAAQIKSGLGNFHTGKNGYVYYISKVHFHYWTNLDLPVVLLGYFPKESAIYWEVITPKTVERTKKKWKLELPFNKKLSYDSYKELDHIISKGKRLPNKINTSQYLNKISGREKHTFIIESINLLTHYNALLIEKMNAEKPKIALFRKSLSNKRRESILKSNQVSILENYAIRLFTEIDILALMNSEFLIATSHYIESKKSKPDFLLNELSQGLVDIRDIIKSFELSAESMNEILAGLEKYKKNDPFGNNSSIAVAVDAIKNIQIEFRNAATLWVGLEKNLTHKRY